MKLKVIREGRPGCYLTSKEQIKTYVRERCTEKVHNMIAGPFMLGADWDIDSFDDFIDNGRKNIQVDKIAITIPPQMGHAIAIPMDKLYLFDCGKITEDDLEIVESLTDCEITSN